MSTEQFQPSHESTSRRTHGSRTVTWYVPITHCHPSGYQDARGGAEAFLRAYRQLWDPMCGVSFTMAMKDGRAAGGYAVTSTSSARARRLARSIAMAARASQLWLGLAEPVRKRPWPAMRRMAAAFAPRPDSDAFGVSGVAMPWLAAAQDGTWHLVVELGPVAEAGSRTHSLRDALHAVGVDDAVVAGSPRLMASVRLHGTVDQADAVVSLLCSDDAKHEGLDRIEQPEVRPFGLEMLAHLLATPVRIPGAFPAVPPAAKGEYERFLADLPSPHRLVVGQSGMGKSTVLLAQGAADSRRGRVLVAVDIHDGDVVRRLAAELDRQGRPFLFVDWSDPMRGDCPVMRISDPPEGVAPAQHAEDIYTLLRHDVWGEMPDEYFGPVGEASTRVGCELSAFDPRRHFGLGDMARLLDPGEWMYRDATLQAIDQPHLTRTVERQIMPMVKNGSDNGAAFVLGKFAPFATPIARRLFQGDSLRVPVEDAVRRGWSMLIHAPGSGLGDDPARLVVAAILRRVWGAVRRSADPPAVTFLLDEWHRYATGFTATLLAEGRKYGVAVHAANQNLAQLAEGIRESVLSNVGAVTAFRVGPQDAVLLDGLYPTVPVRTMQTLPRHSAAVTTFDRDQVLGGPEPLPEPSASPPAFRESLREFWGGDEPPLRSFAADEDLPGDSSTGDESRTLSFDVLLS